MTISGGMAWYIANKAKQIQAVADMEKQKNNQLQLKLIDLELKLQQMSVASPKAPEPEMPKQPETSKLEAMFEQAMKRMTQLESQLQEKVAAKETPAQAPPLADSSKVDASLSRVAPSSSKAGHDDSMDDDEEEQDDDEDEEEQSITTPDGVTVPLIQLTSSNLSCVL